MLPPNRVYRNEEYILVLHDLRDPGAVEALHRARGVHQDRSDVEALDEEHYVLILRPSAA